MSPSPCQVYQWYFKHCCCSCTCDSLGCQSSSNDNKSVHDMKLKKLAHRIGENKGGNFLPGNGQGFDLKDLMLWEFLWHEELTAWKCGMSAIFAVSMLLYVAYLHGKRNKMKCSEMSQNADLKKNTWWALCICIATLLVSERCCFYFPIPCPCLNGKCTYAHGCV